MASHAGCFQLRYSIFKMGGPLNEGTLKGFEVQCPWHGSKFDVRTGEPTKPPARQAVSSYEVKIQDDNILVRKQK